MIHDSASQTYVNPQLAPWALGGAGGVTDGDKGDITVSGGGTVWTIDPGKQPLGEYHVGLVLAEGSF